MRIRNSARSCCKEIRVHVYTVGFAFDNYPMRNVLLVEKKKPDFMAGKLNGIGGSVEHGESPGAAHWREFREETLIDDTIAWTHIAILHRPFALVYVYASVIYKLREKTPDENDRGEKLVWVDDWAMQPDLPYFESVQMLLYLAKIAEHEPTYSTIHLQDVPLKG